MAGQIRGTGRCPVCRDTFKPVLVAGQMDLACPEHLTRPRYYYVDARGKVFKGARFIMRDGAGVKFSCWEAANQCLSVMREAIRLKTYDASKYAASGVKEFRLCVFYGKWQEWLREKKSVNYCRQASYVMQKISGSVIENMDVREVKAHHLTEWAKDTPIAPVTMKSCFIFLRAMYGWLLRKEHIHRDHIPRIPYEDLGEIRPAHGVISRENQMRILSRVPEKHRLIVETLIELGCRPSEVCALRGSDLADGFIVIQRAFGGDDKEKPPKNNRAVWKAVPVSLYARLSALAKGNHPEAYLFLQPRTGGPYNRRHLNYIWRCASRKEGIKISLYRGTRHSLATQRRKELEDGIGAQLAREIGHESPVVTMRYARDRREID